MVQGKAHDGKPYAANLFAMAVAASVGLSTFGADIDVGYRAREEIRVPAGETATQTGRVTVDGNGRLYKTGGGELVLPAASVMQSQPLEIGVLGGVLTLQSGGTRPSVAEPAVIRDEAAFWLDVSSANLITTNGTGYMERGTDLVKEWLDVRATSASDARYLHVAPNWWIGGSGTRSLADGIPPCKVTAFGHTGLWFGGTNGLGQTSGQSLVLKTAAQDNGDRTQYTAITNIFHVFAVHAVEKKWGFLLGTYHPTGGATYRDYYSTGNLNSAILGLINSDAGASNTSILYFDGVRADPWTDKMANHMGLHLMEFETTDRPGHFHALFCDSTTNEGYAHVRCGGDYLYELVVFTNKLTDVERSQVRVHLMNKWGIPLSSTRPPRVDLAGGTTLSAAPDAGETQEVAVTGDGTVSKVGAGTLVLPYVLEGGAFGGTVDVEAGTVALQRDAAVSAADGDSFAVQSALGGDTVTKSAGAGSSIAKTGSGRLSLAAVPAATKTVNVSGGVLRLAPRASAPDEVTVDAIAADPSDRSFESFISDTGIQTHGNGRKIVNTRGTLGAWTLADNGASYAPAIAIYNYAHCTVAKFSPWPAPDGELVFYVKGSGSQVTANVTVPADGVYELSFYASARDGYHAANSRNHIDFYIGTSDDSMTWFGNLVKSPSPYYRHYYRTPRLTGGQTYKLRMGVRNISVDGTTDFDDVRLRLVPDSELETDVVKVPYGDFENVQDSASGTGSHEPNLKGATTAEGWSLTTENGTWTSTMMKPAAITTQGVSAYYRDKFSSTSPYNRAWSSFYDCGGPNVYGFAQLVFLSTGGVATATATFKPPAGTYHLRADVARWTVVASVDGVETLNAVPILEARVTCGSRPETSLGTITFNHQGLTPTEWPTAFTVDGTENVTIALRQTKAKGGALVDNLVLVPPKDLVVNGSFESCSMGSDKFAYNATGWTRRDNPDSSVSGYSSSTQWDRFDRDRNNYGTNIVDGIVRLRLRGQSEIYQSIAFAPGYYRLRFFAESRHNFDGTATEYYGMNPVKAYLTQGTTTNMIGWTHVDSTNYVEHTFLFRVDEAGTYNFHLQGMSSPGTNWGWSSNRTANDRMSLVDCVSIQPVDEADVPAESGLPHSATLAVAAGARVELEFRGTNRLNRVTLDGRSVTGLISAETFPEYFAGPGVFEVLPKGTLVLMR